ncbi:MAG TPA: hypothetical protein VFA32_20780 [Dehalococcoidia bacterium]|jgi:hypothetical protein|nr:hypothetical protein [Dehalococcoidia bacterium]
MQEWYSGREEYLDQVKAAAQGLVQEGCLLAEALDDLINRAALKYDYYRLSHRGDFYWVVLRPSGLEFAEW